MTDKKVSALTAAATLTGAEQVPIVQSGATLRTTVALLNALPRTIASVSGLQAALDAKALDSAVAHKALDETITGIKRFNAEPRYKAGPTYDPREWGSTGGDEALLINAASNEIYSNGLSGTVDLSGRDWSVKTPVLARLFVRMKGRQSGAGAGSGASPTRIVAHPDFVGAGVIKSTSWDGGADDWWHWGTIEDLVVDAGNLAGVRAFAIFQLGEESVIRRCSAYNFAGVGWHFAGYHAVGHLEDISSWGGTTGTYAYEFSTHPTIVKASGGTVRAFGISGDNAIPGNLPGSMLGFVNIENSDVTLDAIGLKAELHNKIFRIAGSSLAVVRASGRAIRQTPASGSFVSIEGTANPTVDLSGVYGSQFTNVVNDVVRSRTVPSTPNAFHAHVVYNGAKASSGALVHHTQGHPTIRGTEDDVPVLSVRRSSASMSESIFTVDDQAGNNLFEVLATGEVLVSGNIAGQIALRPDAANPSLQFRAAGVLKSQALSDGAGGLLVDAPSYFAVRDALNGGNYELLVHAANGLYLSYAAGKIGEFGATPVVKSTGWGAPTGTATKTTFDTATVTLPQLAEHVKALIDYFTLRGTLGA